MAQPEQKFKRKVRKALNEVPISWFFAVIPGIGMIAGVPDYIGVVCGKFVAVEVKTETGKLSVKQWIVHRLIRRCQGIVLVVRPSTLADMIDVLQEIPHRYLDGEPRSITDSWNRVNPPDPEGR